MLFFLFRWIITSAIFNLGLLYAAFGTMYAAEETARANGKSISFPLSSLKLWLILMFFVSLSYIGMEQFPFFLEARALFTWLIITSPSTSHSRVYNIIFDPLLGRIVKMLAVLENNQLIAEKIGIGAVRLCVELAITIMNYVARSGSFEEESVNDIMAGLMFSRNALQTPTPSQIGSDSSSAASSPPYLPHTILR
ncbi:uncharacterized protein TM35_000042600 [Trypanosoma theileri]|uniref:Uncharacterized protein n=1 Tax=Trypanosoma theileri TaxID=67003 RepID=A0A1X0P530_9TRYP|nr:uncharacterized protein TM35_000042600 [Trypanosoma theileri]ORC92046.1 hypothetical protein TM35_000042600 [Trypanosoma theileri]